MGGPCLSASLKHSHHPGRVLPSVGLKLSQEAPSDPHACGDSLQPGKINEGYCSPMRLSSTLFLKWFLKVYFSRTASGFPC